jgi:hypothetical protein
MKHLHLIVNREGFGEAVEMRERKCLIGECSRIIRPELKRQIEPQQRLIGPAKSLQEGAGIIAYVSLCRIGRMRPFDIGQGFLESLKFIEHKRALLQGRSMVRLQPVAQIEAGKRLVQSPKLEQHRRTVVSGVPILRIEF